MLSKTSWCVVSLWLGLACGCSGSGGSGNVEVDVALDPGLAGELEVVSVRGERPGATNPIDVEVVLRNPGATVRRVAFEGSWQDSRGGFQGGTNAVRVLQPGALETFTAGTHSPRATLFRLALSETTTTEDEMLTATLADQAVPKPSGHGITYTEAPTLHEIPAWTPRGVANGAPFTAQTLFFRPNGEGWRLEISDRAFDPVRTAVPRSEHPDLQTLSLDFPDEPASGMVSTREMAYGGGYFQIKPSPGATTTTSWNTALGWALEVTDWNRSAWEEGGATYQRGGTASGKLYVALRGSQGGIANSWVSGTFRDVPIVYYGPPPGD